MANYKSYLGDIPLNSKRGPFDVRIPSFDILEVDYVVVGAGGGGGAAGGGAGGGEVITTYSSSNAQLILNSANTYNIVIGEGGLGGVYNVSGSGFNGESTYISTLDDIKLIEAIGGGAGGGVQGGYGPTIDLSNSSGINGGSGGGSSWQGSAGTAIGSGSNGGTQSNKFVANSTCSPSTGSATPSLPGKDNTGGGGGQLPASWDLGFPYGGLGIITDSDGHIHYDCPPGAVGQWPIGGPGGEPLVIPWVKTTYSEVGAGGGGGWTWTQPAGNQIPQTVYGKPGSPEPKNGGGNTGGSGAPLTDEITPINGAAGLANSGAGGGGGSITNAGLAPTNYYRISDGGRGGSGVVVIRYPSPKRFNGGDITIENGYVNHTFTESSTLTSA